MSTATRKPIVLVPGAWLGGWAWRDVAMRLRRLGHDDVHPVTLTGLGERVHLAGEQVDLETHIADVVAVLDFEGLEDAVLVGHSYGGVVVAGVADRRPQRLDAVVYVDTGPLPDGLAIADVQPPEVRERTRSDVERLGGGRGWPLVDRRTLRAGHLRQRRGAAGAPLPPARAARDASPRRDADVAAAPDPRAAARRAPGRRPVHGRRPRPRDDARPHRPRRSARLGLRRRGLGAVRAADRALADVLDARRAGRPAPRDRRGRPRRVTAAGASTAIGAVRRRSIGCSPRWCGRARAEAPASRWAALRGVPSAEVLGDHPASDLAVQAEALGVEVVELDQAIRVGFRHGLAVEVSLETIEVEVPAGGVVGTLLAVVDHVHEGQQRAVAVGLQLEPEALAAPIPTRARAAARSGAPRHAAPSTRSAGRRP